MTREQAQKELNRLLRETNSSSWIKQEEELRELNPDIANLFHDYIHTSYRSLDIHEFNQKCVDHLIVSNSKLGKALK